MTEDLQKKLSDLSDEESTDTAEKECVLRHKLSSEFAKLATFLSTRKLIKSNIYKTLKPKIESVINGYEYGCFADEDSGRDKSFYRAILWHLEHGINFKGILETLRNRAMVSRADIYFLPGVDVSSWRSQNINVIRDLAIELGYNYFFATSYLHLDWAHAKTHQYLGLEGNAIMTRLPLSNLRVIPLKNYHDPMKGPNKRIGCHKAVIADAQVGDDKLTLVCANLPGLSSQRERHLHTQAILNYLKNENTSNPILIGGDLKTSTYNCKSPNHFFTSVVNKVFRGIDYIVEEHHIYPERHFEKKLFHDFEKQGFDFKSFNELGVGSFHSKTAELLGPLRSNDFLQKLTGRLLKSRDEKVPFKYDWFAANKGVKPSQAPGAERPKVIQHLFKDGDPISNHDPVLLDFEVKGEGDGS